MVGTVPFYLTQIRNLQHKAVKAQDQADLTHKWQNGVLHLGVCLRLSLCSNALLFCQRFPPFREKKVDLGILWKKKKQGREKLKWPVSPQEDCRGWCPPPKRECGIGGKGDVSDWKKFRS